MPATSATRPRWSPRSAWRSSVASWSAGTSAGTPMSMAGWFIARGCAAARWWCPCGSRGVAWCWARATTTFTTVRRPRRRAGSASTPRCSRPPRPRAPRRRACGPHLHRPRQPRLPPGHREGGLRGVRSLHDSGPLRPRHATRDAAGRRGLTLLTMNEPAAAPKYAIRRLEGDGDLARWDAFVRRSPQANPFAMSGWLRPACAATGAALELRVATKGDEWVAGVPLVHRRRLGQPFHFGLPLAAYNSWIYRPPTGPRRARDLGAPRGHRRAARGARRPPARPLAPAGAGDRRRAPVVRGAAGARSRATPTASTPPRRCR